MILPETAARNGGRCMPCVQGTRQSMDEARRRRAEMAARPKPHEIIAGMVASHAGASDAQVLAAIAALAPLEDESSARWNDDAYWHAAAYPFVALADVAALRKLRPAIRLLLDRACFGDPGELMRGLRHGFEAIVNPDWAALADICMAACASARPGTRLWALEELAILEDPRARPLFEQALHDRLEEIRSAARSGLERLERAGP